MAKQNSFDVVSDVDLAEVKNAINQAMTELGQRFDLKGSDSKIELDEKEGKLVLTSADEFKLKAVDGILQQKLVRRGVSLKALNYGALEDAAKGTARQTVTLQRGIPTDKAREIVKTIKNSKLKVQAAINEDFVRVTGKDRVPLLKVHLDLIFQPMTFQKAVNGCGVIIILMLGWLLRLGFHQNGAFETDLVLVLDNKV